MTIMATNASLQEQPPSLRMVPSRLHNFTFPTVIVDWGAGRILRCIKEPTVVVGESGGSLEEIPCPSKVQSISPEVAENRELPWNLTRKRAKSYKGESLKSVVGGASPKEKAKRKFSVSLSKKEIEEDFLLMNGKKPNNRPKKCPKQVQKQLDALFPGMWLSEVTPDLYKVD